MTNSIKKKCPHCRNTESDIHAAIILTDDKGVKTSWNKYACLKCNKGFVVKRNGNKEEQALTEKYIKSKSIILK